MKRKSKKRKSGRKLNLEDMEDLSTYEVDNAAEDLSAPLCEEVRDLISEGDEGNIDDSSIVSREKLF